MKTFFFTTTTTKVKYSLKKHLEVYWINNNHPTNVAAIDFYTASTRGDISEAMQALVNAGILDKKYSDKYYSDCLNEGFEIIELR